MFEHELLLAEIKSIRQEILTPLTNPLSLIDLTIWMNNPVVTPQF
jgi:hypothetical protein